MSSVHDPRVERTKTHKLSDIHTIGLCGMLCGHGDFTVMEEFARVRRDWFGRFLELPGGIPSHDTFGRVFAVRAHWGIENSRHWVLDVVWREDEGRARTGHAAENLSTLRRLALNPIKAEDPASKKSVRLRTLRANWDSEYLLKLIGVNIDA